jgi:hypothetical protein
VDAFVAMLRAGPLAPNSKYPRGLKWFIAEQYLPMLSEAGGSDDMEGQTGRALLGPWLHLVARDTDKVFRQKVQC